MNLLKTCMKNKEKMNKTKNGRAKKIKAVNFQISSTIKVFNEKSIGAKNTDAFLIYAFNTS